MNYLSGISACLENILLRLWKMKRKSFFLYSPHRMHRQVHEVMLEIKYRCARPSIQNKIQDKKFYFSINTVGL
jgi:hypothetical protein